MGSFVNWDFRNSHVQEELLSGEFINAESTLIASGPPQISQAQAGANSTSVVFPIGLLENFGLSQSKQLQRLFEIGSSRSYFVPGRVIGSVSLGRIQYHGPTLLRVLYAYYKPIGEVREGALLDLQAVTPDSLARIRVAPGEDNFWLNLGSDIFNQPFGLAVYFKDAMDSTVGAIYLETAMIEGHQFSISSGSVLIMEAASIQYDRLVPIKTLT